MAYFVKDFICVMVVVLSCVKNSLSDVPIISDEKEILLSLDCSDLQDCNRLPTTARRRTEKICGTDGRTYESLCHFKVAHCKDKTIKFNSRGACTVSLKCKTERAVALRNAKTKRGVFVPVCLPDGTFQPVQCHTGTGYCWCMTATGHVVRETVKLNEIPDCDNATRRSPLNVTTKRPPIYRKGTPMNSNKLFPLLSVTIEKDWSRDNKNGHGRAVEGRNSGGKFQRKSRGCEGRKRESFNSEVMKTLLQEYTREHTLSSRKGISMNVAALQWKFNDLDRNKDGVLRRSELRGIQKVVRRKLSPKKCAKKFPKICDSDSNKLISQKEWTDCFVSKQDTKGSSKRNKPRNKEKDKIKFGKGPSIKPRPCDYERKQVLEMGSLDAYIPKCDELGKYQPIQCYGTNLTNSWYCFCVNIVSGEMIEHTSVKGGLPKCPVHWPSCPSTKEQRNFLEELLNYLLEYIKQNLITKLNFAFDINEKNLAKILFDYLDVNNDNLLDSKERRQLKRIIKKKKNRFVWFCGRKIHLVCDLNKDKKITSHELEECISLRRGTNEITRDGDRNGNTAFNPFIEVIKAEAPAKEHVRRY